MRRIVAALALCLLCAGPARADFTAGMDAYMDRDYQAAFEAFLPTALEGDDMSQYGLGLLYYKGQGVDQDLPRALAWYRLAAAQGHDHASKQADMLSAKLTPEQLAEADRLEAELMGGGTAEPPAVQPEPSAQSPDPAAQSPDPAAQSPDPVGALFGKKQQPDAEPESKPEAAVTPEPEAAPAKTGASGVEQIFGPHLAKLEAEKQAGERDLEPDSPEPEAQPEPGANPLNTLLQGATGGATADGSQPSVSGGSGTVSAVEGLSVVQEPEYSFYYPTGFAEGEGAGLTKVFADPEDPDFANLNLIIIEMPADPGEPMTYETCKAFADDGVADIAGQFAAQGVEVHVGREPGLGVNPGEDFQRCSYMVMYVQEGRQKYAEQDLMYKVGTGKMYILTATYADDSEYYGSVLRAKHEFKIK